MGCWGEEWGGGGVRRRWRGQGCGTANHTEGKKNEKNGRWWWLMGGTGRRSGFSIKANTAALPPSH